MRAKFWQRRQPSARVGIYLGTAEIAVIHAAPGQPPQMAVAPRRGSLKEQLEQLAGGHWRGVSCEVVLASSNYDLIAIDRPPLTDDELPSALPWAVRELTRRPAARLVTDYFQLATQVAGTDKLHVVCSDLDLLQPLVAAVNSTGAELVGITIEELALTQLIDDPLAVAVLMMVPGDELLLAVVRDRQLHVMRRLRGYQNLARDPLDRLGPELVDGLAVELQRSMDYFESQLRQPPVKRVVLALPVDEPALLAEMLARNLPVPVELLSLDRGAMVDPVTNSQRLAYAAQQLLEVSA